MRKCKKSGDHTWAAIQSGGHDERTEKVMITEQWGERVKHRMKCFIETRSHGPEDQDFYVILIWRFCIRGLNPEFHGLELVSITAPPRMHVSSLDTCIRGGAVIHTSSRPWNSGFDPRRQNLQIKITSKSWSPDPWMVLIHASVAERLLIPLLDRGIPGRIFRLRSHHHWFNLWICFVLFCCLTLQLRNTRLGGREGSPPDLSRGSYDGRLWG